jgi:hypothetical protein
LKFIQQLTHQFSPCQGATRHDGRQSARLPEESLQCNRKGPRISPQNWLAEPSFRADAARARTDLRTTQRSAGEKSLSVAGEFAAAFDLAD